jgi:glycosyltransferase involved in cell wall biosynthesis
MTQRTQESQVLVLLPVYNGGRYLESQLDSILAQNLQNILVVCRDDGSSDDSVAILERYSGLWPGKFRIMKSHTDNPAGASANVALLMQSVLDHELKDNPDCYIALADQDDCWYPDKLERCLTEMRTEEQKNPKAPVLIHSDLRVVAEDGNLIADSFAAYQGLKPLRTSFASQLVCNTVTGCTTFFNTALLKTALPVPPQAIMHDWWLGMVAHAFGRVCYINAPLLDYRQHNANTVGAREYQPGGRLLKRLFDVGNNPVFQSTAQQTAAFARQYQDVLSMKQQLLLSVARILTIRNPALQKVIYRLLRAL